MLRSTSPSRPTSSSSSTTSSSGAAASAPLHFLYPTMLTTSSHSHSSSSHGHQGHASSSSSQTHSHPHSTMHKEHHIHTPHIHAHIHPTKAKRATAAARAAADISRLLDPAYSSSSASSAAEHQEVYIDTHGDLHDPDFRAFPTAEHFQSRAGAHSPTSLGQGAATSPTSPRRRNQRARSPAAGRRRPHWETFEEVISDGEEDEEELLGLGLGLGLDDPSFLSHPRYHTRSPSRRGSSSRRLGSSGMRGRDSSFSSGVGGYNYGYTSPTTATATTIPSSMPLPLPSYYSPTGTSSTLPTSYESEDTVLSTMGDEWDYDSSNRDGRDGRCLIGAVKKRRRLSKGESMRKEREVEMKERDREFRRSIEATRPVLDDLAPVQVEKTREEERVGEEDEDEEVFRGGEDSVPTCTQGLRRQWQALSLAFRFGVFRAQRRMMRRVHSLL